MCYVIRYNGASSYLTSGAGRSWDCNKMRHIIRYKYITAFQIGVFEKIFTVVYPECNRPGNIQGGSAANADNGIMRSFVICLGSFIHIRLLRILMDIMKGIPGNIP